VIRRIVVVVDQGTERRRCCPALPVSDTGQQRRGHWTTLIAQRLAFPTVPAVPAYSQVPL